METLTTEKLSNLGRQIVNKVSVKRGYKGEQKVLVNNTAKLLVREIPTVKDYKNATALLRGEIDFTESELEHLRSNYGVLVPEQLESGQVEQSEVEPETEQTEEPTENPAIEANSIIENLKSNNQETREKMNYDKDTTAQSGLNGLVLKSKQTEVTEYPNFISKKYRVRDGDDVSTDFEVIRPRESVKYFYELSDEAKTELNQIKELLSREYGQSQSFTLTVQGADMPYTEVIAPSRVHIPNQLLEKASEE
jgi:hypothetical protein